MIMSQSSLRLMGGLKVTGPIIKRKKQREKQDEKRNKDIIYAVNTVKFTALLALRNQRWGKKRLTRFSEKFDAIFVDINAGRLSFTDIMLTLQEETGMAPSQFVTDLRANK